MRKATLSIDSPCPSCLGPTLVQKSAPRNLVTLADGVFVAYETVRVCAARCRHPSGALVTLRSESVARRVPPGAVYGYDVEVSIGLTRFVHHRQREEIRAELAKHGVLPSSGEISTLGRCSRRRSRDRRRCSISTTLCGRFGVEARANGTI